MLAATSRPVSRSFPAALLLLRMIDGCHGDDLTLVDEAGSRA